VITDPLVALIPGRAFQVIPGVPEDRMKGEEKWVTALAEIALRILQESGRTASVHVYSGNPRIMLVNELKEWNADTVFVGMNSRQSHLLGCVASAVAARAHCSVEVISRTNG
jgi:nucleotide-binding universal stress UspA family protein